ncbi:growth hormone-inducible transmembrane protein [Leptinotarsa decemlineata]|uniref:growth hormone-inducible transmembrane protein n=1 Tax=Leptinotarsa decemlineata TaxID=7539 RepID=UPI000C252D75|nr:growth hormone-inducible transmembrane protein-like [Leptinotarsa decemlineata]XP_023019829.1 growth hormone-inducible transmembrane protein-like [Leptinotarsa decemlineata]
MALMLASRLCRAPVLKKSGFLKQIKFENASRTFANDSRDALAREARKKRASLKEKIMAPAGDTAFNIGKGALAGGSVLGLGALCYYGLGMGSEVGAIEKQHLWPQYVKDRIKTTYMYFGGSIVVTAASALAAVRSPFIMNIVMKNGFMGMAISLAAIMGTGILAQSIEYKKGFGAKQMAWLLHTGTLGAMLAPMCFLGGPLLIRAAWYTAGVVGGLSTIAVCAPSEKFLYMGGPLAMGLGVVFVSSIGTMFLPPTTALGAGLYSISLYGGLLLFSAFLLHDTQRIIAQAERYPSSPELYGVKPYDPINASIGIYLDTLNIFIRIATILAGGGQNRRK